MKKRKILVIDDESGFTHLLKRVLHKYEIMEENDSSRAIETARNFKPELILLDVIMPGLDGGDLASQFKSDPRLKHIPIVFLTAIVSVREAGHHTRLMGGFPFLAKPVSADDLIACIEEHLPVVVS